jgi:aminoglycoside phosphotransferase (APT) family kinase protein
VSGGRWVEPVRLEDGQPAPDPTGEPLLQALARALDLPAASRTLTIERQRLAARSNICVVSSPVPVQGRRRWVVKQPHTGWSQDDVSNPLGAADEFDALRRLHEHFTGLGLPFRVPEPVAFLPDVDALVMEYVEGVTVKDLLSYASVPRPAMLLDGLAASGAFLRHLHTLDALPHVEVDLREQAEQVLAVAEEKLRPLGLDLPEPVRRTLHDVPRIRVTSPQVRLHGDFGPANILLAHDGSTVGLDPALSAVGVPEEDLVRYVALTSGIIRLAPELVLPPVGAVRRRMEHRLLEGYYQASAWPPLFELRYLHQLCRRWCRLRELTAQNDTSARLAVKLRIIGAQMELLMRDSARRLTRRLEA